MLKSSRCPASDRAYLWPTYGSRRALAPGLVPQYSPGGYSEATLMLLVQDREAYERKFAYFLQSAAFLVVVALLSLLYWG